MACLKPNISGSFYPFQARHVSFESSRHGEFLKKNDDDVICTLSAWKKPTSNPGPFDIEAAREKALVKSGHVTPQILDIFVTWPYYGYASTGGELIEVTEYFLKYLSKYIARDTNQDRKINVFMSFFLFPLGSCSLNRLK